MKLSVIVPIFNEARYLAECVDSLFLQKRLPDEVICCIDNRTWDGSGLIAREYPVRLLITQPGKLCVRDRGIRQAKGEIIISVDADCTYPPTYLKDIAEIFLNREYVAASGWHPWLIPTPRPIINAYYRRRLSGSSSAFRKEAYLKIGGFNLKINQHNHSKMGWEEERGFFLKMRNHGRIGWIETPCHHLRSSSSIPLLRWRSRIEVRSNHE